MADDRSDAPRPPLVFWVDVDNTLLDNDEFASELDARLRDTLHAVVSARYWALYGDLRNQRGYADYLEPLQQLRPQLDDERGLIEISQFILDYPFDQRLFPHALEVIAHLGTLGIPVVLSDGDVVLQPRKVIRSGIWDAVAGRVIVSLHKEREIDAIQRRYPAEHYTMIGDKPGLLSDMKRALGRGLTTVFVRQGHYAAEGVGGAPLPDLTVENIDDLLDWSGPSPNASHSEAT